MRVSRFFSFSGKRSVVALICFLVFFVVSTYVMNFPLRGEKNLATEITGQLAEPVGYISDNHIVVQSLFFHKPVVLHSMDVLAANYGNTVTMPELQYSVRDNRKEVIFSSQVSTSEIQDNQNLHLELGDVRLNANQRYFIYFQGPLPEEGAVCPTFWMMEKNEISDVLYTDTGKWMEGRAIRASYSYDVVPMGIGVWLFFAFVLLASFVLANLKPEMIHKIRERVPAVIWCIFWGMLLLSVILNQDAFNKQLFKHSHAVLFCTVLLIALTAGVILSARTVLKEWLAFIYRWMKAHKIIIGIGWFVLLFVVQYIIASNLYQKIGWDVSIVWDIVTDWMTNDNAVTSSYIKLYPNNIGLCLLFSFLRSFVSNSEMASQYWFVVAANLVAIDIGIYMSYRLANRLFGFGAAVCSTLLLSVLIGLSGYMIVPYTDTLTFFIPVTVLYLYFLIKDYHKKALVQGCCAVGIAILLVWGYHLKPQCILVGIAIVLVELFAGLIRWIQRKSWQPVLFLRTYRVALFTFVLGMLIGFGSFSYCQSRVLPDDYTDEASMPMTHFFMMGLNENPQTLGVGGFSDQDVSTSLEQHLTEDKAQRNREIIEERLHDFGFGGFLNHVYQKAICILGDGSFFWQIEGGFYKEDYSKKENNAFQEKLREIYYGRYGGYDDEKLQVFLTRLSGLWFMILFFVMIPCGKKGLDGRRAAFLAFSLLGAFTFTILFEGRSRYLINYLPMFAILASGGIKRFCGGICSLMTKNVLK